LLTEFTNFIHRSGCGDGDIEVHMTFFDLGNEVFKTDEISSRSFGGFSSRTNGEDSDADGSTGAIWQWAGATDHLVALLWVNTHVERERNTLVELRAWQLADKFRSFFKRE
jgi:hypothetical protein